jgi:hypothetical protein
LLKQAACACGANFDAPGVNKSFCKSSLTILVIPFVARRFWLIPSSPVAFR